ncbi:MAG: haloacid dehalogenase type II [Acetobacteraceae bacterium]
MRLRDFDALTFDCYGTLIDWETGLWSALQPLLTRAGLRIERDAALAVFAEHEARQQAATPDMPYAALLAVVHGQLADAWGVTPSADENRRFGESIGEWPPFPDTVEALRYLGRHYRLVILSNVDRASFSVTQTRLGVTFNAVYTAQDIGFYKPDLRNFHYLLDRLADQGIGKDRVLHVAQSLFHDHAPANAIGLPSAWIDRRDGAPGSGATSAPPDNVRYDFRFPTLGDFAAAHRAETGGG